MSDDARLAGSWVRVPEEDHDDVAVYRRRGTMPLGRLRHGLDLNPDGTFTEIGIGRDDTPTERTGRWSTPSAERLALDDGSGGRVLQVVSVEPDRVEIRQP